MLIPRVAGVNDDKVISNVYAIKILILKAIRVADNEVVSSVA